jgi:type VI secretion system VasD/TssJ family lipoprotein
MSFIIRTTLCLFAASLAVSCASKPLVKQPPEWGYEKDAIQLHLVSDPQLNLYQKKPHSLILCLYHLRDPNAFNQLVNEEDGLPRLLECSRFDPSVTYARKLVLQPGQDLNELLDRTDGAKFVGIAAGYFSLRKQDSLRLYSIPITEYRRGDTVVQKPTRLNIDLYLDRQELKQLEKFTKTAASAKEKGKQ